MEVTFYISAGVAFLATVMVITRRHVVHALLYLIVSLLAVAVVFYILGAPFVAALEVIIYAGAIMVLFAFVIMMLGGPYSLEADSNPPQMPNVGPCGAEPSGCADSSKRVRGMGNGKFGIPPSAIRIPHWGGPLLLMLVLLVELVYVVIVSGGPITGGTVVGPQEVGKALYGQYLLGVELVSMLLLAALVGAYHLGRPDRSVMPGGGQT